METPAEQLADPALVRGRHARKWITSYRRNLICTDCVIVAASVFASQAIRFPTSAAVSVSGAQGWSYWLLSFLLIVAWVTAIGVNGAWDRKMLGAGPSEYRRLLQASLNLFGFISVLCYLGRVDVARGYLAMALPLGLVGLLGGRWVWRQMLAEHRRLGSHLSNVLVVGGRDSAVALALTLSNSPGFGYQVSGLCIPPLDAGPTVPVAGFPVLADLDHVISAIHRSGADTVAVSASEYFDAERVRTLAWQLEGSGVRLFLAPALTDVAGPRVQISPVAGLPLMHVQEPLFRGPKLVIKTLLDLFVALFALIVVSPGLLLVALMIKLGDRGPVFFRQERIGLRGRVFRVWKFRSMTVNSDKAHSDARAAVGLTDAVFYKSAGDQRITRMGRFIRRTSIDELPQLLNVLAGQMSLVGPRPLVPGEGAEIGNFLERRMLVRPGITGLWQVSGRSDVLPKERIRLDFYYVENWSVTGDLLILARTVRAVLSRSGAY